MEGQLIYFDKGNASGIVDTRNKQYGKLKIYFNKDTNLDAIAINLTIEFDIKTSRYDNKYAKFKSIVSRNETKYNTEDRSKWYKWGENFENDFIKEIVPYLGIDIRINPSKADCSWSIDLFDYTNNKPADLKTQTTPFFSVAKYFYKGQRCIPDYSVTFNKKDYENYKEHYPTCDIYFWVHWEELKYRNMEVVPINGVWRAHFSKLAETIENQKAPLHKYQNRVNDDYNARESYIFDLLDEAVFECLYRV